MAEKKKPNILNPSAWREARSLMWQYRGRLAVGFGLMVVSRVFGLITPASTKVLIDNVIGEGRSEWLLPLVGAVLLATVIQAITAFALSQVISVAAQEAIMEMRERVQAHVTRLQVEFFDNNKSGELISRVLSDAEGIRNLVGTGIIQLTGGFVTAGLALAVLLYLNWELTVGTIIALLLFGGLVGYALNKIRPIFRERNVIRQEVSGRLGETLSGIRIVKAYGREQAEQDIFATGVKRLFGNIKRTITATSALGATGTFVIGLLGAAITYFGALSIFAEEMTLGDLVTYVFFTGLLATPIIQIANIGSQISEALAGLDRINDLLRRDTETEAESEKAPLGHVEGDLSFENVRFSYEEGKPVLHGVSFEAPAGTTTALVGTSGSGKSTIVGLVMGFRTPDSGRILVDGRDLTGLKLGEYRQLLGVVLQENFLFDGTIRENIAYARPDATEEAITRAAMLANAHRFIEAFEDGYETVVGERGVKLSGGQRQRLAIARAVLADPRILVLDEATSSLDSESEVLIQQGLSRLRDGRTTFVIAHRLSTIRNADQILVVEAGEIVERGTHTELYGAGGRYRELYDTQNRWEEDLFVNPGEETADRL